MRRQNRKPVQIGHTGAWVLRRDTDNGFAIQQGDEVQLSARQVGTDPRCRAERGVLGAIVGRQLEAFGDVFVRLRDEASEEFGVKGRGAANVHPVVCRRPLTLRLMINPFSRRHAKWEVEGYKRASGTRSRRKVQYG